MPAFVQVFRRICFGKSHATSTSTQFPLRRSVLHLRLVLHLQVIQTGVLVRRPLIHYSSPGGGHYPLVRDSEPIRLLEIPTSPSLYMLMAMSTSPEVDNETIAGVNSRFADVTVDDILRMQDNAITSNTKKATKLGMKDLIGKRCFNTHNLLTYPVSFALPALLSPDRQRLC